MSYERIKVLNNATTQLESLNNVADHIYEQLSVGEAGKALIAADQAANLGRLKLSIGRFFDQVDEIIKEIAIEGDHIGEERVEALSKLTWREIQLLGHEQEARDLGMNENTQE